MLDIAFLEPPHLYLIAWKDIHVAEIRTRLSYGKGEVTLGFEIYWLTYKENVFVTRRGKGMLVPQIHKLSLGSALIQVLFSVYVAGTLERREANLSANPLRDDLDGYLTGTRWGYLNQLHILRRGRRGKRTANAGII